MRKLFALFVAAGILAFMACGGGADKEKDQKIKDSLKKDSIAKVEKEQVKADSIAKIEKDMAREDSLKKADPKYKGPQGPQGQQGQQGQQGDGNRPGADKNK